MCSVVLLFFSRERLEWRQERLNLMWRSWQRRRRRRQRRAMKKVLLCVCVWKMTSLQPHPRDPGVPALSLTYLVKHMVQVLQRHRNPHRSRQSKR